MPDSGGLISLGELTRSLLIANPHLKDTNCSTYLRQTNSLLLRILEAPGGMPDDNVALPWIQSLEVVISSLPPIPDPVPKPAVNFRGKFRNAAKGGGEEVSGLLAALKETVSTLIKHIQIDGGGVLRSAAVSLCRLAADPRLAKALSVDPELPRLMEVLCEHRGEVEERLAGTVRNIAVAPEARWEVVQWTLEEVNGGEQVVRGKVFGSHFLELVVKTITRTEKSSVRHHLLDALLTLVTDERTAPWTISTIRRGMVAWLQHKLLFAKSKEEVDIPTVQVDEAEKLLQELEDSEEESGVMFSNEHTSEPEKRLIRALLVSLCPVNVTQIVHMSQTLAAQRRVQEERHRAIFNNQAEVIVYPDFAQESETEEQEGVKAIDEGPKPLDRNEEFLKLLMEQLDDGD